MNNFLRKIAVLMLGCITLSGLIQRSFAADSNTLARALPIDERISSFATRRKPPDKSMSIPPSKLVNFDRTRDRVPDQYIVVYKDDTELAAQASESETGVYKVARDVSASTSEGTAALSMAFARQYGLKVNRIYKTEDGLRGFALYGTSEGDLADFARDPRVKFVEPVLIAHFQTTMNIQSTGSPNCTDSICAPHCTAGDCAPWDLDRIDQVSV